MNRIKKMLLYYFSFFERREAKNIRKYLGASYKEAMTFENSPLKIGILREKWGMHGFYVKACVDLKVSYQVIDIFSKNWHKQLLESDSNFLVHRPSVQYSPWKDMFDNRTKLISSQFNTPIFPAELSTWMWENKLRTIEWLLFNNIPSPRTEIYYDRRELQKESINFNYPLVYKSSMGSGSSGVLIVKNKTQLKNIVKKCFNKGIRTYRKHPLDKEHGYIILQQYIPNAKEWRIIRIGDYYFGFQKMIKGQFHSGSHHFSYGTPPIQCLDLVKDIGDKHNLKYVAVDIFIDQKDQIYVNEIQPYFGQKGDRELLIVDGKSGRIYKENDSWKFEEGNFCENNLCNLRILEFMKEYNSMFHGNSFDTEPYQE